MLPDNLTIAKVTSLFKAGDTADLSNYRPKSVLPCFSKMPEGVIYNHLYQLLLNQEIFHPKQFSFQKDHSTDHALIQLVDQIHEVFEKNRYTLGVSIDLSKAFDTGVLWYTIRENNLEWFQNYLKNRVQFMQINNHEKTRIQTATFVVLQGSFLGSLLFLFYMLMI